MVVFTGGNGEGVRWKKKEGYIRGVVFVVGLTEGKGG